MDSYKRVLKSGEKKAAEGSRNNFVQVRFFSHYVSYFSHYHFTIRQPKELEDRMKQQDKLDPQRSVIQKNLK